MNQSIKLYSYWRSSAAYRVRIALELKHLQYETHAVHLMRDGGEQRLPEFLEINPQGFVPAMRDGERMITQSLAIIEYLEETRDHPALLPNGSRERAFVRAVALAIACDIHPLNNLSVQQYLETEFRIDEAQREKWIQHWLGRGLASVEQMLDNNIALGRFVGGEGPGMAECFIVPQLYNARRFHLPLDAYPRLNAIDAACAELPEFQAAHPDNQPDKPADA
ncbi:MAG: maleylacetoacetate isomerase [Lysobacterales bacterium]